MLAVDKTNRNSRSSYWLKSFNDVNSTPAKSLSYIALRSSPVFRCGLVDKLHLNIYWTENSDGQRRSPECWSARQFSHSVKAHSFQEAAFGNPLQIGLFFFLKLIQAPNAIVPATRLRDATSCYIPDASSYYASVPSASLAETTERWEIFSLQRWTTVVICGSKHFSH